MWFLNSMTALQQRGGGVEVLDLYFRDSFTNADYISEPLSALTNIRYM